MNGQKVQSRDAVTLVGAGASNEADIAAALALAPYLVAADGGADVALKMGQRPRAVIGDFDSISEAVAAELPSEALIRVEEQTSTDFEKCLARIEAPGVIATGFTGGRIDHTLATMSVLARGVGPPTLVLSDEDVIFAAPRDVSLPLEAGTRVSLFPMSPVTGRSEGLEWPIEGLKLDPMGRIGTSNQATGTVRLQTDGDGLLIILPREALSPAWAALTSD